MPLENERELVKKAQRNQKHFTALYTYYQPRINAFIRKNVNQDELAEDLTGTVFEKALTNLAEFQWQGVSFGSWLYRIARNIVYDYYRSARRRRTSPIGERLETSTDKKRESLEERVLHAEEELELYHIISDLSENDQFLLYYRYFEGMSIKEIADERDMSEANVATRLHRIRKKLKGLMNEE